MRKIYVITRRINNKEVEVADSFGRLRKIAADTEYKTGDTIIVINGIVIGATEGKNVNTYDV